MKALVRTNEQPMFADTKLESACASCGGTLDARFTRDGVWAYCGNCRRLTRPFVALGPTGPLVLHPAPAA